jgi:hypothetical protein
MGSESNGIRILQDPEPKPMKGSSYPVTLCEPLERNIPYLVATDLYMRNLQEQKLKRFSPHQLLRTISGETLSKANGQGVNLSLL